MALTKVSRGLLTTSIVDNGNATAITIDASENVGIGSSSPATQLFVKSAANAANVFAIESADAAQRLQFGVNTSNGGSYIFEQKAQALRFGTSDIERMRIDSAGLVGIGGNPIGGAKLGISKSTGGDVFIVTDTSSADLIVNCSSGVTRVSPSTGTLALGTGNAEKMRIDSAGRLLINTTSILSGTSAKLQVLQDIGGQWSQRINNSSSTPFGLTLSYTGTPPNNTSSHFIYCDDTAAARFYVMSNGSVLSATNSYGSTSDLKLKENIVDADSQWDDLKAVRVRKYSFKEENSSEPTQIGVIAQEVEAAGMAGLVYETADQDIAEDGSFVDTGEVTKSMKYSILYIKAVKALQEAMERIETLEAKVQTLENN